MVRIFDKNIFIMLISVMLGAVLITYFAADIVRQSQFDVERATYEGQIETVTTEKNVFENLSKNFTDHIFKSLGSLDYSREYRSQGKFYYDFASVVWYPAAEYEKTIDNCTLAMGNYILGYGNYKNTKGFFNDTLSFTTDVKYTNIIKIYKNISNSGAIICYLGYNLSLLLRNICENLSLYGPGANVSELLDMFNETNNLMQEELENYEDLLEDLEEEYAEFFNPIRETP